MQRVLLVFIVLVCVFNEELASSNGPAFYKSTDWYKSMGWCRHAGSRLAIGDFNGDGRADMMCHDSSGNKWIALANTAGQFTGTSWHKPKWWCTHKGSQLFLGDFNGDGRTDMLCHDQSGNKWVALATIHGSFTGTSWHRGKFRWCYNGAQLHIGDFNGDGRADLFCTDKSNIWISLAQPGGKFLGTSSHKRTGWCSHAGSSIHVADFNGDLRDDLLCHDNFGRNWVMLALSGGKFSGRTNWHSSQKWCTAAEIHLGYLNGDKRADILCQRPSDGYKWVATARSNIKNLYNLCSGSDWQKAMSWCSRTQKLFVADFNNDGRDDLLCHDQKTGKKWISYNRYCKVPCSPNPCGNGADCITTRYRAAGYRCKCLNGFKGKRCEIMSR